MTQLKAQIAEEKGLIEVIFDIRNKKDFGNFGSSEANLVKPYWKLNRKRKGLAVLSSFSHFMYKNDTILC